MAPRFDLHPPRRGAGAWDGHDASTQYIGGILRKTLVHISIQQAMMGRSRSLKLKTWPLRGGVGGGADDSIASPPSSPLTPLSTTCSSPPPRFDSSSLSSSLASSVFFWAFGIVTVALSGLELSYAPVTSVKHMWSDRLFTEYIPPGSEYIHLVQEMKHFLDQNDTEPIGLWDLPKSYGWQPCLQKKQKNIENKDGEARYIQVFCTGGLFQLHICICNAVAVAWLLNAFLVVPHFREHVVWKDTSYFEDIYDIDHFMSSLKDDIRIVRQLPPHYGWSTPEYYENKCLERPNCFFFIPKHARKEWYFENVLPVLQSQGVVALDRFHHKLSFEGLPNEATRLRCKTNFHALRFVKPILDFSLELVSRIKSKERYLQKDSLMKSASEYPNKTSITGKKEAGYFLGLHLRFEKDMIAHSACYYGGGRAEQQALASYRRKIFRNIVPKAAYSSEYLRQNGSCPLTPEEVGLLLCGLGFRNTTPIYVAGKDSYGGRARVRPLQQMFPHIETKETLASKEELQWFLPSSHKLAALDFTVLLHSDTFLSNSAGNFPNVLTGQRTFLGPRKSIHPDKAALFKLFSNASISWNEFSSSVGLIHKDRQGSPYPRNERYSVFRYPAPDCMCRHKKGSGLWE